MSFANGEVSYAPAGSDEWVQAQVNRPIVTGDQLWADNNSRAELSVDNSSWWLGEQTSVTVSNLDDRIAQFQLQQGTLEFRVRRLPDGNIVEVDTPNLAFTVSRPGQYRVVVDPQDGATTVSVRSGGADVYGEGASYAVASGQSYRFYGTDLRDSELASLPPPDAFDRFVAERDRRYERNVSVRYVSPEVVGYEDLDTYGTWSAQPTYGNVWFPRDGAAPAGRRTAKATGRGSIRGAGRGSTMSRGASRRSITAAGRTSIAAGAGCRVRERFARCMRRRSSRSSADRASASPFRQARRSAGFRSDRATSIGRRIA